MTRPAPAHAALLCDFVNTYDVGTEVDELRGPADLVGWLVRHGLLTPGHTGDAGEPADGLATAIALREGLRAAMRRNHGPEPLPLPDTLETAVRELPLRVSFARAGAETTAGPELVPLDAGVRGGLARIVAAIIAATADGTWHRLKVCQESTCQWAFVDTSKNRSRTWCSMQVCGNRTKTRAYRARRRTER
jgi:predicted RNA-binding Zn ribbon-like protein